MLNVPLNSAIEPFHLPTFEEQYGLLGFSLHSPTHGQKTLCYRLYVFCALSHEVNDLYYIERMSEKNDTSAVLITQTNMHFN